MGLQLPTTEAQNNSAHYVYYCCIYTIFLHYYNSKVSKSVEQLTDCNRIFKITVAFLFRNNHNVATTKTTPQGDPND